MCTSPRCASAGAASLKGRTGVSPIKTLGSTLTVVSGIMAIVLYLIQLPNVKAEPFIGAMILFAVGAVCYLGTD